MQVTNNILIKSFNYNKKLSIIKNCIFILRSKWNNYKQVNKLFIAIRSQTLINKMEFAFLCWRIQPVKCCTSGVKENPEPGRETSREQGDAVPGDRAQWKSSVCGQRGGERYRGDEGKGNVGGENNRRQYSVWRGTKAYRATAITNHHCAETQQLW